MPKVSVKQKTYVKNLGDYAQKKQNKQLVQQKSTMGIMSFQRGSWQKYLIVQRLCSMYKMRKGQDTVMRQEIDRIWYPHHGMEGSVRANTRK